MPAILSLLIGIVLIIVLTTRLRVHPFFALLLACFVVGAALGLPLSAIISRSKEGFGHLMQSLGFVLVLGTTLGVLLEHTGATHAMALLLVRRMGKGRTPLAMSITGYLVGLPIFCDSGYIVLSGLGNSLARRAALAPALVATALATGLYSVHCLIPPHPGATAAAVTLGVGFGKVILLGMVVALPAMLAGYGWARYAAGRLPPPVAAAAAVQPLQVPRVAPLLAFLPLAVPIMLIAARSFVGLHERAQHPMVEGLLTLGDPVLALGTGIGLTFLCKKQWRRSELGSLLETSVEKAGAILMIIGAGGAFGAILATANLGAQIMRVPGIQQWGLLVPFAVTCLLKTAQGSSTVAIITAASIVQPLLVPLGLSSDNDRIFTVLAMGAGSMAVSHANDAYFWVIGRFAGLPVPTMLRVYTLATVWMAVTAMAAVWVLHRLLA